MPFFTALLLLLAGCDTATPDEEDVALGTMTALIDGARFEADFGFARPCLVCEVVDEGESIELGGTAFEGTSITFGIIGFSGEGTYAFTHGLGAAAGISLPDGRSFATDWQGGSGSIEVTHSTDDVIEGTFSFTALEGPGGESIQVTEGRFSLPRCDTYDDPDCFTTRSN